MKNIFFDDAQMISEILIDTIKNIDTNNKKCDCTSLRKETLLKDVYNEESNKG